MIIYFMSWSPCWWSRQAALEKSFTRTISSENVLLMICQDIFPLLKLFHTLSLGEADNKLDEVRETIR
jgi:hypothetical protein